MGYSDALKILIADDNQSDRLILSAIVKKFGHSVVMAENGEQAVQVYAEHKPDLVLLDVMMPVMDGMQAARIIKEQAGEDLVPILFLTSLQDAQELANCLDSGGDDFLTKPYNKIILLAKIKAFSRMRKMHATLQDQRDVIQKNNEHLMHEQQVAKAVYDNVAHSGCLHLSNIRYLLSPFSVFNGDVLLAARKPSGGMHLLLGDFTGHGLPAAIGAMPLAEIFYGMTAKGFNIGDIIREINIKLKTILPVGLFCCACMAHLSFRKKELEVWMGGLPDFYIYRNKSRQVEAVKSNHLPLGVLDSRSFDASTQTYKVDKGDKFYMWSDGILEARNNENELFGEKRLLDIFSSGNNPDNFYDDIINAVNLFVGDSGKDDDTTLLELTVSDEIKLGDDETKQTFGAVQGPTDWHFAYTLRNATLHKFNPLPLMLHLLSEVPALRSQAGQIYTLMAELYSNAYEHGVLGLSSDLKQSPEGFAQYYAQRTEKAATVTDGHVTFEFDHTPKEGGGSLIIRVTDSGPGFDYASRQTNEFQSDGYSGRGIPLIRTICQSLQYKGNGNIVEALLTWRPNH
ncbi:MAG: SpoIIE family protein phosphatase [Oceanospirillaceae bacterium]|nr:SpoIIE family protein phosphatase [Oceanospirillaceae bacterium]MCP5350075.1 SpoIIE family protein phosphatase [Oceanospirillaceae bacterium]